MVRLSIVIPALRDVAAFESTLVSVLSNRPAHCEVIVVLSHPYDDPYELSDEVRFVDAPHGANWAEAANCGMKASEASIVHLLHPGVQVTEGWTHLAVRHFHNPEVAAVAPLVLNAGQPDRVLAAGVDYHRRGERLLAAAGVSTCAAPKLADALGPTHWAGFYRRSAVLDLLGGFDGAMGEYADVDLALRLRAVGYRCVSEARSQVATTAATPARFGVRGALRSERLFWRALAAGVGPLAIAPHVGHVARELIRKFPVSPALLVARLIAAAQVSHHMQQHFALRAMRRKVTISLALANARKLRIDEAEATLPMSRHRMRTASPQRRAAA